MLSGETFDTSALMGTEPLKFTISGQNLIGSQYYGEFFMVRHYWTEPFMVHYD